MEGSGRSGEPLERDPSGDDGEGSKTTSGEASPEADADVSVAMVRGRSTLPGTEAVESIAMRVKRKMKGKVFGVWRSLGAAYDVDVNVNGHPSQKDRRMWAHLIGPWVGGLSLSCNKYTKLGPYINCLSRLWLVHFSAIATRYFY